MNGWDVLNTFVSAGSAGHIALPVANPPARIKIGSSSSESVRTVWAGLSMGSKKLMLLRNARCVPKHRNTKIKERGYNLLSIPLGRFKEGSPQTSLGVGPNFSGRRNPEASALIKSIILSETL